MVSKEEADQILNIPISQHGKVDFLIWHPNTNGIYSVKSGYHLALAEYQAKLPPKASSSFDPPKSIWKFFWSLKIPPLKHFWWKVCCNFLATKVNLYKRKCSPSPVCPICCKENESIEHLLFRCDWTKAVWFGSSLSYKVDTLAISSVMKWSIAIMEHLNSALDCRDTFSKCIFLAWHVWKARNDWVFNGIPVDPKTVLAKASSMWKEFRDCEVSHRSPRHPVTNNEDDACWIHPCEGKVKVNCDVAVKPGVSKAAIAALIRDDKGNIVDGQACLIQASSGLQGEALAVRLAGSLLSANHIVEASIESDNQSIIKLCSTENVPPWECATIVDDIRKFSLSTRCSFSWVRRNCNRAAHWIATNFLKGSLPLDWVSNPPPSLSSICNVDASLRVF